jgi:formylglycine-generating enzyme required for sulfatase activity
MEHGQRVLVLGDLGAYGSQQEQRAWLETAESLRKKDAQMSALVPVPASRMPGRLAHKWSVAVWEQCRRAHSPQSSMTDRSPQERAERLLRICSPAAFVQLGLLRALRRLLPARDSDAGTEADVFAHHKVAVADPMGVVLLPERAAELRKAFVTHEPEWLQARVSHTIREWHQGLPAELLRMETLSWLALGSNAPPPGDPREALAFADRLASSLRGGLEDPRMKAVVARCAQMMLGSLPATAYQTLPKLQSIFAGVFANQSGIRVPDGLSPQQLYAELVWAEEKTWWSIRQVGAKLVLHQEPDGAWPSREKGPGSPVAWLLARRPQVFVKSGAADFEIQHVLRDGLELGLQPPQGVRLRTDCSSVTIASWTQEPWATAAGRDRYGLWADARIEGIAVRFRYIPPGRFLMGSPESEAGRFDREGPQHEVTWTQGYWLADAPCTQAVWERVMGENPSRFVSAERPVEQVSWDDCQAFLKRLNESSPELMARLPSEAEWEHACRGGTPTATWVGDLEILGECNAPLLDEIAWYTGNSGQDYELEDGHDSTDWPNKQYPHTKAGTHEVRKKQANPHGLHDMLGNVLEWCMDTYGSYEEPAVTNPAPSTMGPLRVYRGGSWIGNARLVRAAIRFGYSPDNRVFDLGFRLARGQGGWEAGTRSGPAGRGEGLDPAASALREAGTTPARSADQK